MLGSVTVRKVRRPEAPSVRAASSSARALLLHERDELAGDERERHEDRGEHDARQREDDLQSVGPEPGPEQALRAEQQHVDEARHHRRDREGQVDQRDEEALAAELELRDRPGGRDAEDEVERHGDGGDGERQPDRGARVRDPGTIAR